MPNSDPSTPSFICPACNLCSLSLLEYTSLMVLRRDLGLFTIDCPDCGAKISSLQAIPENLHEEVMRAAAEVHAGMGAPSPMSSDAPEDED